MTWCIFCGAPGEIVCARCRMMRADEDGVEQDGEGEREEMEAMWTRS